MKNLLIILATIAFWIIGGQEQCSAQCKDFTENEAMPLLEDDYIISGRYNTLKLKEGEDILVFKTLTKGIEYRFVVLGDDQLPKKIQYKVETWEGKELFNNVDNDYKPVWDYKCSKTMRVKIYVNIPKESKDDPKEGCITILNGIKAANL